MSSLTEEWHLKRKNGIKYWIDIPNFRKKMNWRSGKEIYSRKFKISESVFSIDIYPNGGTSEEEGYVSVYLTNNSNWRVRLSDVTFKVEDYEDFCTDDYYQADGSWGLPKFVSHRRIKEDNLLDNNGRFTLAVDVDLLEEEVTASRPVDSEGDALLCLKNEIKEELESQKQEFDDMKSQMNQLRGMMGKMMAQMTQMTQMMADNSGGRGLHPPMIEFPSVTVQEKRLN